MDDGPLCRACEDPLGKDDGFFRADYCTTCEMKAIYCMLRETVEGRKSERRARQKYLAKWLKMRVR